MTRWIAFAAALALTAPAVVQAAPVNAYQQQLLRLPVVQQRAALRSSILGSGLYCRRIGDVAYQQPYKNLFMWVARCDSGADYGLFVGPDGTVQPRLCRELPKLKLPECRIGALKAGPKPPPRPKSPALTGS
ncbi:hypothetical protein PQ455_18455 [Sphingomonas naphthae]|uniref:Uncharacterized protein n=1 Tax=Sphingomonas naphthae TaxID=1813468 RepID=A0ABY7TK07_9SPHN|nr:hypothetical protein [Sphingomonas naphthae]WCT73562.1 hypothetical protein PQ455_18455 [Sphingomonas naphthae]